MKNVERIVFVLVLASCAYFVQAGGWNHNSRFDVARALVEHHTLRIDAYRSNTGDIAELGGHYYSDKAPVAGVLAAPVYALAWAFEGLFASQSGFLRFASYLVTVAISGGAAALASILLFRLVLRTGASARTASLTALAYGLGSFALPFGTVLFGHDLAALFLLGSFYALTVATRPRDYAVAGLLAMVAAVTEYPTAGASAVVFAWLVWTRRKTPFKDAIGPFLAGAVLPAAGAMLYAAVAFGNPLTIGYSHVNAKIGKISTRSNWGVSYPHPQALWALLFGPHTGLFAAPVLLVSAAALVRGLRRERTARLVACAGVVLYYVLFVASYEWWDGGASFGPRHLVPMLPFLCLGGATAAERWPRVFGAALAVSALVMLAGAAHTPVSSMPYLDVVRRVLDGEVPDPGVPGLLAKGESTNLGLLALAVPGLASLAPLVGFWIVMSDALARATKPPAEAGGAIEAATAAR